MKVPRHHGIGGVFQLQDIGIDAQREDVGRDGIVVRALHGFQTGYVLREEEESARRYDIDARFVL